MPAFIAATAMSACQWSVVAISTASTVGSATTSRQSVMAMKAGKHVYCQKPMSLGVREGQEMVRVAKASGVTFHVGSQQRSAPEFRH